MTVDGKSNTSDLLESSLRIILSLPQSETRCKLLGRNAQAAVRAGCGESARSTARLAATEVRAVLRSLARGFAEVEIANICVECDLSDLARELLADAEEVLKSLKPSPAVSALTLMLSDGLFQLGDLKWAENVIEQETNDVRIEFLAGMIKRYAKRGMWVDVISRLSDQRLQDRRKALCAETLVLLAESEQQDVDRPSIAKAIESLA